MGSQIDDIIANVSTNIYGRFPNGGNCVGKLLEVVELAGDGNYLEIGVLHGGSLCAVGMLKSQLGHIGNCVGVDPFNGFYFENTKKLLDRSGIPVNIETVIENLGAFGVKNYRLISAESPDFNVAEKFTVAYVDGDHTEEGVLNDWKKVSPITTRFVVFHDYNMISGVTKACDLILSTSKDWKLYYKADYVFILEHK
jgi:hypothetical protein